MEFECVWCGDKFNTAYQMIAPTFINGWNQTIDQMIQESDVTLDVKGLGVYSTVGVCLVCYLENEIDGIVEQ